MRSAVPAEARARISVRSAVAPAAPGRAPMELPNASGAVDDLDLPPMPMPESRGGDPRWTPGASCPGIAAGGCRQAGGRNQQIGEQAHHLICNVAANVRKIHSAMSCLKPVRQRRQYLTQSCLRWLVTPQLHHQMAYHRDHLHN